MAKTGTYTNSEVKLFPWWEDLKALIKLRLSLMVVVSAVFAYLIACGGTFEWYPVVALFFGGMLVTGAANALNQVLEKEYDKHMNRTANRPLPTGRMTISTAVLTAGLMSLVGLALLASLNPLTGFIGALSLVLYSFVYTPMKRVAPISVAIGAIPGALPTMIGCVAFQGELTPLAWLLFGVQFFWQFPHFWAIAELAKEDYRKAGFKIIADDATANTLGYKSLMYATMILPLVAGLYLIGYAGIVNTVFLTILTLVYMWLSYGFAKKGTRKSALAVMFASFAYLPFFLIGLMIEQFLF